MGVGRVLLGGFPPPPQEGLAKVLGGVQFCLLYRPRNPFLNYFLSIFLNFFCDKIQMVFSGLENESGVKTCICTAQFRSKIDSGMQGFGRKLNPGSKPRSVQHKSGRKWIPVSGNRPKTRSGVSELQRFRSKMDPGIPIPAENQIRGL